MKKFTLALLALLVMTFSLKAQQYVSTTPANRNVILEEFTGRNCGYCTDGHRIANEIMAAHPGRAWAINVHTGGYAPTSYPNFNTTDGAAIASGFSISGYPCGVVNRSTSAAQDRGQWANTANQQLNQASECNIGGMVVLNPASRLATITVEVYYTGSSAYDQNFLTIAMLQDSILGSQSDYGNYNPTQWLNGQYVHMHILRDVINQSAWGDAISPTTQGTLITRTYTYEIPEVIGSPNGVEVDLDNIFFLAWVSERQQGVGTRPILTGCELDMVQGSDEPIYPFIKTVSQQATTTCTHTKIVEVRVQNGGTESLNSMTFEANVEGETTTVNWEGELPQYGMATVEIPVEVPFGNHNVEVTIVSANGQDYEFTKTTSISCMEWVDISVEGAEEELKLELMQDKFGNQITWEATASDGTVIASGGPYSMLVGGTTTQLHIEHFTVPANECVKFSIFDNVGNGMCCDYGQGYYIVYDSHDNVIFGDENDGDFGSGTSNLVSIKGAGTEVTVGETEVEVMNYTDANFVSSLEYEGYPDEVGFEYQKEGGELQVVVGIINEFRNILATVDNLEASSTYTVRAYAMIGDETYYGEYNSFNTWNEGVNELDNSLKLFPNPVSEVLNLVGEGMNKVEIYNAMGQLVLTEEVNGNATISTSALCNGFYFVRIYAQNGEMATRNFSVVR